MQEEAVVETCRYDSDRSNFSSRSWKAKEIDSCCACRLAGDQPSSGDLCHLLRLGRPNGDIRMETFAHCPLHLAPRNLLPFHRRSSDSRNDRTQEDRADEK